MRRSFRKRAKKKRPRRAAVRSNPIVEALENRLASVLDGALGLAEADPERFVQAAGKTLLNVGTKVESVGKLTAALAEQLQTKEGKRWMRNEGVRAVAHFARRARKR